MILENTITNFIENLKLKGRSIQTIQGYNQVLQDFKNWIEGSKYNGVVYVDELLLEDLEDYLQTRKDNGDANVSVNRSLYILRSFFDYMIRRDIISNNISLNLEPLKVKQSPRENLTKDEIDILLEAIDHDLVRLAVRTLSLTGLRVSELCDLSIDDVDLDNRVIYVINGKGGKDRQVPISEELYSHLDDYIRKDRPDVASNNFFALEKTGSLSPQYINRILKDTTKKLGWDKHITAHILRHSFATNLIRNDAPLPAIQRLLGHSDLRVTSLYIQQNLNELQDAVNLL